ncbi:MAG: M14 family zinc carboxypeptidase [Candidatus Thorarchaeota archaeon]|nr:M14 family zinc carboxypeptidase [Candidatus Thorarchaeota archaeon]
MPKTRGISRVLLLFALLSALVLPSLLMPIEVKAATPIITAIETPSIDRTWEDVSVLYQDTYLNSSMVEDEVENILDSVPELVDVIGQSYEGRDILSIRLTNEDAPQQKAKTLVVAHHHGREKVTVNTAIYFMLWLVNGYGEDPEITEYLDTEEIYVIPTLNPDALNYIYNYSDHWLRKNLRPYDDDGDGQIDEDPYEDVNDDGYVTQYEVWTKGPGDQLNYQYAYYEGIDNDGDGEVNEDWIGHTDLNRNYDSFWSFDQGSSPDPLSQVFKGTTPFSEPETQVFRDFALQHRFGMAYSLHTGINATYFPTNSVGNWEEGALYTLIWDDYETILPPNFNYYLDYSAVANSPARPAVLSGSWDNWMYSERDCLAPITFEIFNNATSEAEELYYISEENSTHVIMTWNGIYEYFSPDEPYIEALWEELIPSFEYLLEQTPRISVNLQGSSIQNNQVHTSIIATCLSPRIETIDNIEVQLLDGTVLDWIPPVESDTSLSSEVQLEFASVVEGENATIRVGNEFAGYHRFVISFVAGIALDPLVIGGITIALVAVVIVVVYLIRRSK